MLLLIFLIIIASTLSVFYIQESHQKRNSSCMNLTSASSRILLSLSETHKETNQWATLRRRCTQASQLLSSLHSCTVVLGWVLAWRVRPLVVCWGWLTLAHKSYLCTSLPNHIPRHDLASLWWEYLHHGNQQMLQIRFCTSSKSQLFNTYQHPTACFLAAGGLGEGLPPKRGPWTSSFDQHHLGASQKCRILPSESLGVGPSSLLRP